MPRRISRRSSRRQRCGECLASEEAVARVDQLFPSCLDAPARRHAGRRVGHIANRGRIERALQLFAEFDAEGLDARRVALGGALRRAPRQTPPALPGRRSARRGIARGQTRRAERQRPVPPVLATTRHALMLATNSQLPNLSPTPNRLGYSLGVEELGWELTRTSKAGRSQGRCLQVLRRRRTCPPRKRSTPSAATSGSSNCGRVIGSQPMTS